MSLMAGFDFVAEISNETIRKLIERNLTLGGTAASPPFEFTMPLTGLASGTTHLIFTGLDVDLNSDDTVTLTLAFDRGSAIVTAPLSLTVCPLDGSITITAPLILASAGGSSQQVSVNLAAASVSILWSAGAKQVIMQTLGGVASAFTNLAAQTLTSYVQSLTVPSFPIGFTVVGGSNGSLSPTLQFEKLEVHCIANAQRGKQALGLFGILLVANHAAGDHTQKTATAITAANDGICISISPAAFHSLLFCPAIAKAFGTNVPSLPGSCGAASSLATHGVMVTGLVDIFSAGHIDILGSASKSGFCYDAKAAFNGTLSFSIGNGALVPSLAINPPSIDVEIPWYCWLAAGVVLGPVGIAVTGIGDAIAQSVDTTGLLNSALGGGFSGTAAGGLPGAIWNNMNITPEGLTLEGILPLSVSSPFNPPMLTLSGSVMTTVSETVGTGTFNARVWCLPAAKDYPYTELLQHQTGVYQLSGKMVIVPLTPQFVITVNGIELALPGPNGTVALPNVQTYYPMPLATGGTAMQQTVHVGYRISGSGITLTNDASEGNYGFRLSATAADCTGQPILDGLGNPLTGSVDIQFEGHHVNIGGGYAEDVQQCGQLGGSVRVPVAGEIPLFPPVNYPPVGSIIEYIGELVAAGTQQAEEILIASKNAHGNSFVRAFVSQAAALTKTAGTRKISRKKQDGGDREPSSQSIRPK